jgi:hypothetical protein
MNAATRRIDDPSRRGGDAPSPAQWEWALTAAGFAYRSRSAVNCPGFAGGYWGQILPIV